MAPQDKAILSNGADYSLQLHPTKYPWAWDIYLKMMDNGWTPREIPMAPDVAQWRGGRVPDNLSHMFLTVFSQLTTFDHQRSVDLAERLVTMIQAPEIKHALIKQAEQECLHSWSYQFCIENLGLDTEEIYSRWERVPILKARVDLANNISEGLDPSSPAKFAAALAFWFLGFEGVWFMLNLRGPVQAMARNGLMLATAEQFQYIARDEEQHIAFGTHLIRELLIETGTPVDGEFGDVTRGYFEQVMKLEEQFIEEALQGDWVGYTKNQHVQMAKYLIDQRLRSLWLTPMYNIKTCPLPWMAEMLEIKKEKNFFETRVTEYRTGNALQWD